MSGADLQDYGRQCMSVLTRYQDAADGVIAWAIISERLLAPGRRMWSGWEAQQCGLAHALLMKTVIRVLGVPAAARLLLSTLPAQLLEIAHAGVPGGDPVSYGSGRGFLIGQRPQAAAAAEGWPGVPGSLSAAVLGGAASYLVLVPDSGELISVGRTGNRSQQGSMAARAAAANGRCDTQAIEAASAWLLAAAAELALQIGAAALSQTQDRLRRTERFGIALAKHQGVRQKMAGAATALQAARALWRQAHSRSGTALREACRAVMAATMDAGACCQELWGAAAFDLSGPVGFAVCDLHYLASVAELAGQRCAGSQSAIRSPAYPCAEIDPSVAARYAEVISSVIESAGAGQPQVAEMLSGVRQVDLAGVPPIVADAIVAEALAMRLSPGVAAAVITQQVIRRCYLGDAGAGRPWPDTWQGAIAVTEERSGSDLRDMATVASVAEGWWRLDGQKAFVCGGMDADFLIVAARTDLADDGFCLFFLPAATPGLDREEQRLTAWSPVRFARVSMRGVRLPRDARSPVLPGGPLPAGGPLLIGDPAGTGGPVLVGGPVAGTRGLLELHKGLAYERLMVAIQQASYARRCASLIGAAQCRRAGHLLALAEALNASLVISNAGGTTSALHEFSMAKLMAATAGRAVARALLGPLPPGLAAPGQPAWPAAAADDGIRPADCWSAYLAWATAGGAAHVQEEVIALALKL